MMEPIAQAIHETPLIRRIQVGTITEKVTLYANHLILFFSDPGPSLKEALALISSFSGLKVNVDKSRILPNDETAHAVADPTLPLKWTTSTRYLGVIVSSKASEYCSLNLLPLLQKAKQRTKVWNNLPLYVIGKINLIKMKLLPSLLYILRHSPVWIPMKYFKPFETTMSFFLWGSRQPRFRLVILQRPWTQGG